MKNIIAVDQELHGLAVEKNGPLPATFDCDFYDSGKDNPVIVDSTKGNQ